MACNCNKCNPNKHCGCNDASLATPCSYSDCGVGSERCADVQCAECVSYCGTTFEILADDGLNSIRIESGERFDSIVQKFALILAKGLGACTAETVHHAPYNLFATDIISTDSGVSYQATIQWNHISSLTQKLSVIYENVTDGTGALTAVTYTGTPVTQTSYVLSTLLPGKLYKVFLQSCSDLSDPCSSPCNSVVIEFTTPSA